jgi:hypothetical protein
LPRPLPTLRFLLPACRLLLLAWLAASPAGAQPVLRDDEELDFDRPEAWAMAWFGAVTLANGIGGPAGLAPGEIELAFAGGWVPSLSREERRVGFRGNKVEDLNRTAVVGRPTITVGLPAGWTLEGGWMPPLDVDGIEPNLVSLALARTLWQGERLRLAARVLGEDGRFEGDLTCSRDDVRSGPDLGSPVFIDCEAPSEDEMEVTLYGAELQASAPLRGAPRLAPYATVGWARLDAALQIDARYNGLVDRSRLSTEGSFWTAAAGIAWEARPGWRLAGELFYAPLDVVRRTGGERENDALVNARAMLSYRVR